MERAIKFAMFFDIFTVKLTRAKRIKTARFLKRTKFNTVF